LGYDRIQELISDCGVLIGMPVCIERIQYGAELIAEGFLGLLFRARSV
jgi:hypothetical protein